MKTKVSDILRSKGHDIWSIGPDAAIIDALRLMAEKRIGALLVMDGEKLVGIFSERDYARKVALEDRSSRTSKVRDIMSTRVLCAKPEQTVEECMALMTDKRARHLPILEHKKVVGVVSIGDLVKAIINEQQHEIEQLQYYITH
ncbi:MAG: CBS domain-containing protein [Gammaproteobacteria bacterium]|nr:MAG: CBS domain-containing protein [Gammaproteobacteria bacterium]